MRAVLFHNPKSGKKGYGKDNILAALKLADHSARYVSSKSEDFKAELAKVSADFVVAAGGDGTVAKVIANLGDRKLPIGILPLGTANNIARSLDIGGEPQILVESWRMDRTRRLDIGRADWPSGHTPFVEAFGLGLLAQMILKADKKDKEEGAHNLRLGRDLLRKVIKDAKQLDLEILIDGKKLDGQWIGVEVLNVPYTGPGLALAPKADFGDGFLELVCFEKAKREELCEWLETPVDAPPPAVSRRGKMITLKWRDAAHRIDDSAFKADDAQQLVTLTCDDQPVQILESRLTEHKTAAPARLETAK